jgi:hypothetical protein
VEAAGEYRASWPELNEAEPRVHRSSIANTAANSGTTLRSTSFRRAGDGARGERPQLGYVRLAQRPSIAWNSYYWYLLTAPV